LCAAHAGDHAIYPDCRPEFLDAFAAAMRYAWFPDKKVKLITPFAKFTKTDIVRLGATLKPPVPFKDTYSCYMGEPKHCGVCATCRERKAAFELAGITDPTEYAKPGEIIGVNEPRTAQEVLEKLLEAHDPELAKKEGMVAQIWEDGEYTLQKSGPLLWQRNLHCIASGHAHEELRKVLLEGFPCQMRKHAYVYVPSAMAPLLNKMVNNWRPKC